MAISYTIDRSNMTIHIITKGVTPVEKEISCRY